VTGVAGIRGIHGLSCTSALSAPPAAGITLDGNSTSIEDVYINGFSDGILVGSQAPAQADVLSNITGGTTVSNLIYIDNITASGAGSSNCPPSAGATENVCDLSVLHATSAAGTTISDKVTGATLSNSSDANVGMYILGEQLGTSAPSGQYSRFSTSPTQPTWGVGTSSPSGFCNATSATGSLYSNTSASSTTGTLFACANGSWVKVK
jgi:hypothetical protein